MNTTQTTLTSLAEQTAKAQEELTKVEKFFPKRDDPELTATTVRLMLVSGTAWLLPPFLLRKLVGIYKEDTKRAQQFVNARLNEAAAHAGVTTERLNVLLVPDQQWIGRRKGEGENAVQEKINLPTREEWRMLDSIMPIDRDAYWLLYKELENVVVAAFPKPERNGHNGYDPDGKIDARLPFMQKREGKKKVIMRNGKTERDGGKVASLRRKATKRAESVKIRRAMQGAAGKSAEKKGGESKKAKKK